MTTADWAIIISLGSLTLSLAGFVWNIWSKFIYPKPSVKVEIASAFAVGGPHGPPPECVSLSAVDHGPGEVQLQTAVALPRRSWFGGKRMYAILPPMNNWPFDTGTQGPFSGGLPKTLNVGQSFSAHFPRTTEFFEESDLVRFGFKDSFGRYHWASKRKGLKLRKSLRAQ